MIVYRIRNKINGKAYIGQTMYTAEHRWKTHCQTSSLKCKKSLSLLHLAINKYAASSFTIETLGVMNNREDLNKLESNLILFYNTIAPNGYNITKGGGGVSGFRFSEESKKKMSAKILSEAQLNALRSGRGRKLTDEERKKISDRMKLNNPQFGKPGFWTGRKHTSETKEKMRIASTGKPGWNKGLKRHQEV